MRTFLESRKSIQIMITMILATSGCIPITSSESFATQSPTLLVPTPSKPSIEHTPIRDLEKTSDIKYIYELGLTFQQEDGSRFVQGKGNIPAQNPLDITLPGVPTWVVAAPYQDGIIWYVTLQNGNVHAYISSQSGVSEVPSQPSTLPPGMPPLLRSTGNDAALVMVPNKSASEITHPIWLPQTNYRASILSNGDLAIDKNSDEIISILPVNALPDARMLVDERERILLLTDPTNRYSHGVLGDTLEAARITLIETFPEPRVTGIISLPEDEVVEGIAPIWVDLTGDGKREIIVTISDRNLGAGIVVFSESGERIAEGPKMGQPNRWRHQIAVGEFMNQGGQELAVVRTPHIGGVLEFYRYFEGDLNLVAQLPGLTSHIIGSRNLDLSVAGDFDGNGVTELLVLNPSLTELVAVRRIPGSAEIIWRIPLDGILNTNLASATLPDGNIVLGLGRLDGVLRIWYPQVK